MAEQKIAEPYRVATDTAVDNEAVRSAQTFLERNLKIILGVAGALLAAAVVIYFVRSSNEKKSQEATLALSRVRGYYESADYAKALAGDPAKTVRGSKVMGLRQIADQYSGTEAGKVAAMYAGNALLIQQNGKDAARYFEIALDSESPTVAVGANAGMAATKELSGQFGEAAKLYERAAELGAKTGFQDRYTLYAGICYEKAGDKKKAEELFREVTIRSERSEYTTEAKTGLIRLGTIIE